jgi:hypothetical protein
MGTIKLDRITARVEPEVKRGLKRLCESKNQSESELLRYLVVREIAESMPV